MSTQEWIEKDYYKVLGVKKDADPAEIKKSYRKLARELHPDRNKDDPKAEARFKDVSEAYSVLSDAAKRKEYDETRALFAGGGGRSQGGGPFGFGRPGSVNVDLGDLFGQGASGVGDIFGGLFRSGAGSGTTTRRRRGTDVRADVTLTFDEAVYGKTVRLRLTSEAPCGACAGTGAKAGTVPRVCPSCEGTGTVSRGAGSFDLSEPCRECRGRGLVVDDPCEVCKGSGRGERAESVPVRIPAGIKDGATVRARGKGAPGEGGGPAGDLLVKVRVRPHPVFSRDGDNLKVTVPITFAEAALGGPVQAPTLDGRTVTIKLPEGTPNGRVFRARGKGGPRKDGTAGDLLVTVEVAVPQRLDKSAREAVEKLAESSKNADVRSEVLARAKSEAAKFTGTRS